MIIDILFRLMFHHHLFSIHHQWELEFVCLVFTKDAGPGHMDSLVNVAVSDALEGIRKENYRVVRHGLCKAITLLKVWADMIKMDFFAVIDEKLEYNETRPDHLPENREKAGGKKF